MTPRLLVSLLCTSAIWIGPAAAQDLPFTANASSLLDLDASIELLLPGTLVGDFDATSNPGGTRTLPGLFGGSGNQPIATDFGLVLGLDIDAGLSGGAALRPDAAAGTFELSGLQLAAQLDPSVAATLALRLEFETFRTFAPDSVYFGGFPLEIPLGSAALGDVVIEQVLPATGTLVSDPGTAPLRTLDGQVVATLTTSIDFAGQTVPVGPIPLLLPLTGTVDLDRCDALLDVGLAVQVQDQIALPAPFEIDDLPLPLPTILPPGETANLLVSVALEDIGFDVGLDADLTGEAPAEARVERYCLATPNTTGAAARLDAGGTVSTAAADLVLLASDLPADRFGFLLASQVEDFVPGFGGSAGNLCLGEPCVRFTQQVQLSGPGGAAQVAPDFGNLPMGAAFTAGETWRFQYWFRDGVGSLSNTTDALRVLFCE